MPCYSTGDRGAITTQILNKVKPLTKFLGENAFMTGRDVTYVDFTMFELCEMMEWISEGQLLT